MRELIIKLINEKIIHSDVNDVDSGSLVLDKVSRDLTGFTVWVTKTTKVVTGESKSTKWGEGLTEFEAVKNALHKLGYY